MNSTKPQRQSPILQIPLRLLFRQICRIKISKPNSVMYYFHWSMSPDFSESILKKPSEKLRTNSSLAFNISNHKQAARVRISTNVRWENLINGGKPPSLKNHVLHHYPKLSTGPFHE